MCVALAVASGALFCAPAVVRAEPDAPQELPQTFVVMDNITSNLVFGDQTPSSLCWAYSSVKMLETYIYNHTDDNLCLNISEEWISLAYMNYAHDPNSTLIDKVDNADYAYSGFGNALMFEHALNAYGFVLEEDYDKTVVVNNSNYKAIFEEYKTAGKVNSTGVTQLVIKPIYQYNTLSHTEENNIVQNMKKYLHENKTALVTSINSGNVQNSAGNWYAFYDTANASLDHAMTIVGYDDTKTFDCDGESVTGAFIALNSYGSEATGNRNQKIYLPYSLFVPRFDDNVDYIPPEINKTILNTFYIDFVVLDQVALGGKVAPSQPSSGSIWQDLLAKFSSRSSVVQVTMLVALSCILFLVLVAVLCGINAAAKRSKTSAINHQVLINNLEGYQLHRQKMQQQEAELVAEIAKLRAEKFHRKQHLLKRKLLENLHKNK